MVPQVWNPWITGHLATLSVHVLFYKKLKSGAGRQFVKIFWPFGYKKFLTCFLNFSGNEFFKLASKVN